MVRDALDRLFADMELRRSAINSILAASETHLPDNTRDLRRELDAAHDRLGR